MSLNIITAVLIGVITLGVIVAAVIYLRGVAGL